MDKIEVVEKNDITPLCPHCEQRIETLYCRRSSGIFGKRYVYFCPRCSKLLGVSHRKGNIMGS